MAQKMANVKSRIEFHGRNPESILRVYSEMVRIASKRINKRTNLPFTVYGELSEIIGKGFNHTAQVDVVRKLILGNWQNDIKEFARNAAKKLNVDVTVEII